MSQSSTVQPTDTDDDVAEGSAQAIFIQGGTIRAMGAVADLTAVRDHLGTLLQVQNLVVLIGSGASFHLGSPRTRSLPSSAIEALIERSGSTLSADEQSLLRALNPDESGDLEKLLDLIQTLNAYASKFGQEHVRIGATEVPSATVGFLRAKLNRALAKACQLPSDTCQLPDPLLAHRTMLSRLARARRASLPRTKIFTTNYDLVLEKSLDELGYPYVDGFSGTVERRLSLPFYGLDHHRVDSLSQRVVDRSETSFYLHKVHGSLNWRASSPASGQPAIESIQVRQVSTDPADDESVLIYPTATKEGDTLAYPYADLLRLLSGTLQQPDTAVLSIGYGFQDAHINRILLGAQAMNSGLHLTVVDPFGVFDDAEIASLAADPRLGGRTVAVPNPPTPVGQLASRGDSRIAVITGPAAVFESFVQLLPDPGIRQDAPNRLAELILGLTGSGTTTGPAPRGAGA